MCSQTNHWDTCIWVVWIRHHWSLSTYLHDIFTSCKLRHQKLRSLNLLPKEIVTRMRQQQRRVWCLNTDDQCNIPKMVGEWNTPTNKSASFWHIFGRSQSLEIVKQCLILYSAWRPIQLSTVFLNSKMLNTSSLESSYSDRCMFKKIHDMLHYEAKRFIYNSLAYLLDTFSLWNWEKVTSCQVTFFSTDILFSLNKHHFVSFTYNKYIWLHIYFSNKSAHM